MHALVPATWLSCVHPRETLEPYMAPTVDQIAVQHIGQETPWPSLETATAQGQGTGSACERGYGCTYTGTLSFRNATSPLESAAGTKVNPSNAAFTSASLPLRLMSQPTWPPTIEIRQPRNRKK